VISGDIKDGLYDETLEMMMDAASREKREHILEKIEIFLKEVTHVKELSLLEIEAIGIAKESRAEILRLRNLHLDRTREMVKIIQELDEAQASLSLHDVRLL
jgi:hypothetical protein